MGEKVKEFWRSASIKNRLDIVEVHNGYGCLAHMNFRHELSLGIKTLYTQLMFEGGILGSKVIHTTLAHTKEIIDIYGISIDDVFGTIKDHLNEGSIIETLKGPLAQSGFMRLNT